MIGIDDLANFFPVSASMDLAVGDISVVVGNDEVSLVSVRAFVASLSGPPSITFAVEMLEPACMSIRFSGVSVTLPKVCAAPVSVDDTDSDTSIGAADEDVGSGLVSSPGPFV